MDVEEYDPDRDEDFFGDFSPADSSLAEFSQTGSSQTDFSLTDPSMKDPFANGPDAELMDDPFEGELAELRIEEHVETQAERQISPRVEEQDIIEYIADDDTQLFAPFSELMIQYRSSSATTSSNHSMDCQSSCFSRSCSPRKGCMRRDVAFGGEVAFGEVAFEDITPTSLSPVTDILTDSAFEKPKKRPNFVEINKLKVRLASLAVRLRKNLDTCEILILMKEISELELQLARM